MNTRNILMISGAILLVAGGVYYFAVIRKRSTEAQFNSFKEKSLKTGWDVLATFTNSQAEADVKAKWLKNLTKADADRMIQLAVKKEKDMSASEIVELKQLMIKWLKSTK